MKRYLTNQIDIAWMCEACDSAHSVQYSWPKAIIIDEGEIQNIANHHHKEWSPKCLGFPSAQATRGGRPLEEYRMTPYQKAMMVGWLLFPFMVAAAIGVALFLARVLS